MHVTRSEIGMIIVFTTRSVAKQYNDMTTPVVVSETSVYSTIQLIRLPHRLFVGIYD